MSECIETSDAGLEHAAQLLLEVSDLIAQPRCNLELQLAGGGSHLLAELFDEVGEGVVLACSALKRRYRDVLRQAAPQLKLVLLHGSRELLGQRITQRVGHTEPSGAGEARRMVVCAPATLAAPRSSSAANHGRKLNDMAIGVLEEAG